MEPATLFPLIAASGPTALSSARKPTAAPRCRWQMHARWASPRSHILAAVTLGALCLPALTGCATPSAASPAATASPAVELDGARTTPEPQGPDGFEVYDAATLYQRGVDLFEGQAWAEAALYFERVLSEFPGSSYQHSARYQLTECYLNLEDGPRALGAADAFLAGLPAEGSERARLNGRFKRGAALALLGRHEEVAALFDEMLGEPLSARDELEALVDSGVGHFMRGDHATAEQRFLRARRVYEQASITERLQAKYFVAQASFYLAEIAREDYSALKLRYPSDEEAAAQGFESLEAFLGDQLEQKCQRLLRAQFLFLRVIREQHLGWASAAGYKVGSMYEELYNDLVGLDDPNDLTEGQRELFRRLLEEKVMVLLEKAVRVWQSTTDMAVRAGAENEWIEKTRASLARVKGYVLARARGKGEAS